MQTTAFALGIASWLLVGVASAETAPLAHPQDEAMLCLAHKTASAIDTATIGELRAACAAEAAAKQTPQGSVSAAPVLTQRLAAERDAFNNRYVIAPYRLNYLLLGSYAERRPSNAVFSTSDGTDTRAQKSESKFQISLKFPLWLDAFGGAGDFLGGYTQRSFWQMYNRSASSPFRETNYEPELWFSHVVNQPFLGWNLSSLTLGVNHQSNGRGSTSSRSWNRVIGSVAMEHGGVAVVLRPWWRIPEKGESDDNPDITDYMGHFDLTLLAHVGEHTFDLMLRDNLRLNHNHGAMQLGWSFPFTQKLKVYAQWFYGYGESLIDYKLRQNTLGVGIQLIDW
ncbi:phospholipase A [Uliginosibacterium gangwonense]|uniref:phospholipase A n=1 Tax=Uliginosibacterium gangwonense TaxID=392736 RepID=UPI00037F404E|nr:phospholipase A [Uliginosibacterium gangwonense]